MTRDWRVHSCLAHPWRSCWNYRPITVLAIWSRSRGVGYIRWRWWHGWRFTWT